MRKPLVIIAGFLGAGKTTLLMNLIEANKKRKLAVLINDFGEVPVDAALVAARHEDSLSISQINGGSVFCSCRQDSFVKALSLLADMDVDMVVVEASGNSDPTLTAKILAGSGLDAKLELTHVLCLFDPVKSYKLSHVLEVIPHQVAAADVVLLSKSDITSAEEKERAKAYISAINETVPVIEITQGRLDFSSLPPRNPDRRAEESTFQPGLNRPTNFTIAEPVANLDALLEALARCENVLRVKGFVHTPAGAVYVSDTGRGFEVVPSDDAPVPLNILCTAGKAAEIEAGLRAGHVI